jgi:hypothetical protein
VRSDLQRKLSNGERGLAIGPIPRRRPLLERSPQHRVERGLAVIFHVVYNHASVDQNHYWNYDGYERDGGIYFANGGDSAHFIQWESLRSAHGWCALTTEPRQSSTKTQMRRTICRSSNRRKTWRSAGRFTLGAGAGAVVAAEAVVVVGFRSAAGALPEGE